MKYKVLGNHPVDFADGRVAGPGAFVELPDKLDQHDQNLLDDERLLLIPSEKRQAPKVSAKSHDQEGDK